MSHSTKAPATEAFLHAVSEELRTKGYEVLLDKDRLVHGDKWYDQISEWIMKCEGALLLWDHEAASSDFVRHEASLLGHRWRTEEDFKLFIARLDDSDLSPGLPVEALSTGALAPSRIADVHLWRSAGDAAGNPQAAAEAIVAAAELIFGQGNYRLTRHNRIVFDLQQLLACVGAESLRIAAAHLQDSRLQETLQELPTRFLDRVLASWMVETAKFDLPRVRRLVEQIRLSVRKDHKALLDLLALADAAWLESAGCPFATAMVHEGGSAVVATNGAYVPEYTLKALALRALGADVRVEPTIVRCNELALDKEEVAEEIAAGVGWPGKPRSLVNQRLKQRRTVCLLPKNFPGGTADYGQIEELKSAFPHVIFVVWPSVEPLVHADVPFAALVVPSIDLEIEEKRYVDWHELTHVLSEQPQG